MATNNGKTGAWYVAKTNKVTMKEFGREDLYAIFKDPASLPYGAAKDIQAKFKNVDTDSEGATDDILNFVIDLIVEWNITDPTTGEKMEKPKKAEDLLNLPQDVLMALFSGATATDEKDLVPLEKGT